MKRLAAILFLSVLLFNLCGYRLVIDYLQQQHEQKLTAQLDKDQYENNNLISIKTPLLLPYYNASTDFERVDGSIRLNGVEYNYVKRRVINDSLELLCVPNTEKQKLQTAKADFFGLANDLQRTENNKKSANILKTLLAEYYHMLPTYHLQSLHLATLKHAARDVQFCSALFTPTTEQPPEARQPYA